MSEKLMRQALVAEIERVRTAWDTANPSKLLKVDYENQNSVTLATQVLPFIMVDIVFRDTQQMDLNPVPNLRDDGQIILAVGVKDGSGTQASAEVRDFVIPYLQLRDNLAHGLRTHEAKRYPPMSAKGFYYLPLVIGFWRQALKPTQL